MQALKRRRLMTMLRLQARPRLDASVVGVGRPVISCRRPLPARLPLATQGDRFYVENGFFLDPRVQLLRTISGGYQYSTKAVHHEKLMKNVS